MRKDRRLGDRTETSRAVARLAWSVADVGGVLLGAEQLLQLARFPHSEPDHPSRAVRVLVDERRIVLERTVHLDHLAGDRAVQLRDRLHRLDGAERLHFAELSADGGKGNVDDVSELAFLPVRDADLDLVVGIHLVHELVLFGVQQMLGGLGHRNSRMLSVRAAGGKGPRAVWGSQADFRARRCNSSHAPRARRSSSWSVPSLSMMRWLVARFKRLGSCAPMRASASAGGWPR